MILTLMNLLFFVLPPTAPLFRHKHLCSQVMTRKTVGVKHNGEFSISLMEAVTTQDGSAAATNKQSWGKTDALVVRL